MPACTANSTASRPGSNSAFERAKEQKQIMRKVAVSTAIMGILAACAFVPNPAIPDPARSQEYRLAYMAGCDCGFTDAGRDGFQNAYQLDEKRFQSDSEYRNGWQDGYGACFAEQRRTPFSLPAGAR